MLPTEIVRHPDPPADHLDPQFVGLHVLEIDLPPLHELRVDLLALPTRLLLPEAATVRSSNPKAATMA